MRIILFGAPGVGKGTYGDELSKLYQIPRISTGDMLREAVKRNDSISKDVRSFMDNGKLVPDSIIQKVIDVRLSDGDCKKGFILDGYPRTVNQAELLAKFLNEHNLRLDIVINIELSKEIIIKRLTNRRVCKNCGANYNLISAPPKKEGICDRCKSQLITRTDDEKDKVMKRLEVYEKETKPVISYYKSQGLLSSVKSEGTIAEAVKTISGLIELKVTV